MPPEALSLLKELNTSTFKGKPSIFSFWGRVSVTYAKMLRYKHLLLPVLHEISILDARLSVARLIRESQNSSVKFCFPEFIDPATTKSPIIELENFWHPMLDPQKAVPNNITLGGALPQNGVITGPNAGGKSTVTKGVAASVIMAQTLGISPADKMRFTPFSKIMTYLNIVDDVGAGDSLFKAGLKRAQEVWGAASGIRPTNLALLQ